jgi:hypothetical protein
MFANTARMPLVLALVLVTALALTGCATSPDEPDVVTPPTDGGAASGSRLAPGLYDIDGGKAQAVGTLEWKDLEGGFWAIIGGTESEGNLGTVVAVIANGADFADQLEGLEGHTVMATGTRLDGASIRMAGPEIEIDSIEEISDTPGAAD